MKNSPENGLRNGLFDKLGIGQLQVLHDPFRDTEAPTVSGEMPMNFTYPPGSTPLPRYTVRRGIGLGGFGEVYFAISDAGKEVALKRIQRNLEVELRGVAHCLNLKNPHLVSLFDVCQDSDQQWWVVMEYVAGENLRQVLDRCPTGLPIEEVNRWFSGIASGVAHLHHSGLVHRDVKPGNVFDDQGIVKVGDYGLSKFISASHRGGHTESVGTFHYMAPEIGKGSYGREIDIYALGIVLYELITGHVPFDGESCQEIIVKHLTARPDLADIQEPYRSTIWRCLEKDPSLRFPTVEAMMTHLGFESSQALAVGFSQPDSRSKAGIPDHTVAHRAGAIPVPLNGEPVFTAQLSNVPNHGVPNEGVPREGEHSGCSSPTPSGEPFARAVRKSMTDLKRWWRTLDRSPGAKAFLLVVVCLVLAINTHWLLPLLSLVAIVYVPYYVVRQMVLHVRQQPSYAQAQAIAATAGYPRPPMTKVQWRGHVRSQLRAKHSLLRLAELNTSWIAAVITVGITAAIAVIVGIRTGPINALTVAPYVWTAVVVVVASFALLSLGKLWERDDGEGLTRRIALSGTGATVGAIAFLTNDFLMLPLSEGLIRDVDASSLPQALYSPDGIPSLAAMMAHFALLFACLRWWKPVDPLRRTRLSLWAVAVAVVIEWMVHQLLPIPQPTGMFVAGGIAFVIQMSAPWVNPRSPELPTNTSPFDPGTISHPSVPSQELLPPSVATPGELA